MTNIKRIFDQHFPTGFLGRRLEIPDDGLCYRDHLKSVDTMINGMSMDLIYALQDMRMASFLEPLIVPPQTDFPEIEVWNKFVLKGTYDDIDSMRITLPFLAMRSSVVFDQIGAHFINMSEADHASAFDPSKSERKLDKKSILLACIASEGTFRDVMASGDASEVSASGPQYTCFETHVTVEADVSDIYNLALLPAVKPPINIEDDDSPEI